MVPAGIACSYPLLPETPRYLVYRGRFKVAEAAIEDLYRPNYNAVEEVQLVRLQVEEQRELRRATRIMDSFKGLKLATNHRRHGSPNLVTGPRHLLHQQLHCDLHEATRLCRSADIQRDRHHMRTSRQRHLLLHL